jgi:hypothetical protein
MRSSSSSRSCGRGERDRDLARGACFVSLSGKHARVRDADGVASEIDRYIATGDYDSMFLAWPCMAGTGRNGAWHARSDSEIADV